MGLCWGSTAWQEVRARQWGRGRAHAPCVPGVPATCSSLSDSARLYHCDGLRPLGITSHNNCLLPLQRRDWQMPVIPALGEAEAGRSVYSRTAWTTMGRSCLKNKNEPSAGIKGLHHHAWFTFTVLSLAGTVVHTCDPNIWLVDTRGSRIQGHSQQNSESGEVSLGYMGASL